MKRINYIPAVIQIIAGIIGFIIFTILTVFMINKHHFDTIGTIMVISGLLGIASSYTLIHFGIDHIRRKERDNG